MQRFGICFQAPDCGLDNGVMLNLLHEPSPVKHMHDEGRHRNRFSFHLI
jgi:hypothetical protein